MIDGVKPMKCRNCGAPHLIRLPTGEELDLQKYLATPVLIIDPCEYCGTRAGPATKFYRYEAAR